MLGTYLKPWRKTMEFAYICQPLFWKIGPPQHLVHKFEYLEIIYSYKYNITDYIYSNLIEEKFRHIYPYKNCLLIYGDD